MKRRKKKLVRAPGRFRPRLITRVLAAGALICDESVCKQANKGKNDDIALAAR